MKIYLICPVRNAEPEALNKILLYTKSLEEDGHQVHFPARDVNQNDPTGESICQHHLSAMKLADRVDVYWDKTSSGSHFDLGMAYALGKEVKIVELMQEDTLGKSYVKVMQKMQGGNYAPNPEKIAFSNPDGQVSAEISLSHKKAKI